MVFSLICCQLCCLPHSMYTFGNVRQQWTDYFIIIVNLLPRRSANNLKCINFIVFILYFCEFGF